MTDIQNIIERCKIVTLAHQPFFGAGASKMTWEIDDSISTACTNGEFIKFNSDFIRSLTKEEMVGLAVHEVMHVYSKHHLRRGDRDHELWNVAGDYFINLLIQDAIDAEVKRRGVSCMKLPDGGLIDDKYRGWSTEDIYNHLKQESENDEPQSSPQGTQGGKENTAQGSDEQQQNQQGQGQSASDPNADGEKQAASRKETWGEVVDAPANTPAELQEAEREVEVMVEQAHNLAKSRGKHFGSAEELLDTYKKPSVDWKSVLRQLMQSLSIVDYTYRRPHRNTHHILSELGAFIPDYHRENMGEIVVAIDTSGSCSSEEVTQFLGEIQSICEELQPSKVYVVQCDARVQHVDTFDLGQPFKIDRIHGRGGTDFQPVFDWVEAEGINPMALVYLTDGYAPAPDVPDYPVYWGVTSPKQGHLFGEVMSVNFSQ